MDARPAPGGDEDRDGLPHAVRRAAATLRVSTGDLAPSGGASGRTWKCGAYYLRVGPREAVHQELAAMAAASSALPVAEVVRTGEFDAQDGPWLGALLTRLPGHPAAEAAHLTVAAARRIGERCGHLHETFAAISAPSLPPPAGWDRAPGQATGAASLLHLDLHPLNVLVDDAGSVTGVVDFANAAAGPAVLDRARTWSVLTLDPLVLPLLRRPAFVALRDGWFRAGALTSVPDGVKAWACQYMLDDLSARHPPHRLAPVRHHLRSLMGAAAGDLPASPHGDVGRAGG